MVSILCEWVEGADQHVALPAYETAGAAGADLRANLPEALRRGGLVLAPGARAIVPTGLRVGIPEGFEMQVRARSGLAAKHGVCLANGVGTIDADYRGPVGVILINLGTEPFVIEHGARVAQAVVAPVVRATFAIGTPDATKRGAGGFGSTGVS